jgi:hypothetical protein
MPGPARERLRLRGRAGSLVPLEDSAARGIRDQRCCLLERARSQRACALEFPVGHDDLQSLPVCVTLSSIPAYSFPGA